MKKHCKICGKKTKHVNAGEQTFPSLTLILWNCTVCGGTTSEKKS
jgi:hypothetical protein